MKTKKTSLGDKTKASAGPRPAARKLAVKKSPAPVSRPATGRKMAAKPKAAPIKVAKPKTVTRKALPEIPAILLETERSGPSVSGPGEKFALGPTPPVQHFESEATELPTAYGTGRLFLTARDPHWLYANWDLTRDQQLRYNAFSTDGHLILRIYVGAVRGEPVAEIHVHPESRHWFAHVERAETRYAAELGYYEAPRQWTTIATSGATLTPPDTISPDTTFSFATIPVEVSFARLVAIVQRAAYENMPLAQAVEELRKSGHPDLPSVATAPVAEWTPAQERALAAVINVDHVRRVWIGSLEITELIRRQLESEISSIGVARFGLPSSPGGAVTSISSPFGGEQAREKGFWFNVNAELIIYGATERDATVTIGGRKIKLRPDGSFSYRFALPDGRYELPVVAVSADGTDGRAAELKFSRQTEIRGDVGTHPQDPRLKPPTPENV